MNTIQACNILSKNSQSLTKYFLNFRGNIFCRTLMYTFSHDVSNCDVAASNVKLLHLCFTHLLENFPMQCTEEFLPARRCATAIPASVSVCHKSEFYRNGWTDGADYWNRLLPSTYFTLCWNEIRVSPKTRALPSGTLSETLDFKNLAMARLSSQSVVDTCVDRRAVACRWYTLAAAQFTARPSIVTRNSTWESAAQCVCVI